MPLSSWIPAFSKARPGPGDEVVGRGRRHRHGRRGGGHDPRREMDREPANVARRELDLAGVDACPDLDPARPDGVGRSRPPQRMARSGAIEDGEEPVAGRTIASRPRNRSSWNWTSCWWARSSFQAGAEALGDRRRVDDVGEEDRAEDPLGAFVDASERAHPGDVDRDYGSSPTTHGVVTRAGSRRPCPA